MNLFYVSSFHIPCAAGHPGGPSLTRACSGTPGSHFIASPLPTPIPHPLRRRPPWWTFRAVILFPLLPTPIPHPLRRRPPRSPEWPFFCPFRFLLLSIFPSAWVRHWKIIINICNWLHNYLYIFLYNLLYIRYFLHL